MNSVGAPRPPSFGREAELKVGDVLRFVAAGRSAVACRSYLDWCVGRVLEGPDARTYVRLNAVIDPTVTKLVLLDMLRTERFTRMPVAPETLLEQEDGAGLPLQAPPPTLCLRSRRARAATFSDAAE